MSSAETPDDPGRGKLAHDASDSGPSSKDDPKIRASAQKGTDRFARAIAVAGLLIAAVTLWLRLADVRTEKVRRLEQLVEDAEAALAGEVGAPIAVSWPPDDPTASTRNERARNKLAKALEIDPDHPKAILLEGLRLVKGGDLAAGKITLERARSKIRADSATIDSCRIVVSLATILFIEQRCKDAIPLFEESYGYCESEAAYVNHARCLLALQGLTPAEQQKRAEVILRKGLAQIPFSAIISYELAVLAASDRDEQALGPGTLVEGSLSEVPPSFEEVAVTPAAD